MLFQNGSVFDLILKPSKSLNPSMLAGDLFRSGRMAAEPFSFRRIPQPKNVERIGSMEGE